MSDDLAPPARTASDIAYGVVKAAVGSVPLVGAAGAEIFALIVSPPLEKRRDRWMASVGEKISKLLDDRLLTAEALGNNSDFLDAALAATQSALRTGSAAKLEALRNAVVNSALPGAPSSMMQQTYLRFIDELHEWHLRLLDFFDDPSDWAQRNGRKLAEFYMAGPSTVLESTITELQGKRDYYDQWWRDLHVRGLVGSDQLHVTMTGAGAISRRTTALGRGLLEFIREPAA